MSAKPWDWLDEEPQAEVLEVLQREYQELQLQGAKALVRGGFGARLYRIRASWFAAAIEALGAEPVSKIRVLNPSEPRVELPYAIRLCGTEIVDCEISSESESEIRMMMDMHDHEVVRWPAEAEAPASEEPDR